MADRRIQHRATLPAREIELDFIRGIAILLVVDYHNAYPLLAPLFSLLHLPHIGWVGVDMFFVLSGFLVGGLLMKEWAVRRSLDSKRFLIRRAFKIWPQYYLFIITMLVTHHLALQKAVGNLLNIQNYLPGVSHTWSLAVEEHVYLLLLACFVVGSRTRMPLRRMFLFFAALCLAEIALRYLLAARGHDVFLPTHTRVDGILYGVLLAMLYHFAPAVFERLRSLKAVWVCCLPLAIVLLRFTGRAGWRAALHQDAANLLAVATLLLLYQPLPDRSRSVLYRSVSWIGLYSYGIYLWHVVFIRMVTAFGERHPRLPHPLLALLIALLAITAGALTTQLVEFPMLRLRDRLFPKRIDSAVGPSAQSEAPATALAHL